MMNRAGTRRGGICAAIALAVSGAWAVALRAQEVRITVEVPAGLERDLTRLAREAADVAGVMPDAIRAVARDIGPVLRAFEAGALEPQNRNFRSERTDRTTQTLTIGAAGSLELRNVSGDITVTAGTGRDVTIEIERVSRGRTESDAARGLDEVKVSVDHRGERALVETVYPRGNLPYQVSATYTVTAPAGTRVSARSISGDVSVRNIKGDVAAEAISGDVVIADGARVSRARSISGQIRITDVNNDGALNAGSVSGNVVLTRVRASRIAVDVISGDVRAEDVASDSAQLRSSSGSVEYVGRLSPNGRYEFNSHSGSVRLVAEGPVGFEVQATTFSGRIRPEGLSLQSMSMTRGSLRARVGDGSAVVVAQTFSGDVVLSRK